MSDISEGDELGKIIADERISKKELSGHISALMVAAQKDPSLSDAARTLAAQDDPFNVDRGANVGVVEGTLAYTFLVAAGKGAAGAAGGLAVKELWSFIKKRLQRRDPAGIRDVIDNGGDERGSPSN